MRSERLRLISILLGWVGLVDSVYLSWIKITHQEAICSSIGDCEAVNTSIYSEIFGIPIALLGVGAYALILAALHLEGRLAFPKKIHIQLVYGLSFIGLIYSAYLTYIEIAVLKAICPFCVVSAIAILLIFICSIPRLMEDAGLEEVSV